MDSTQKSAKYPNLRHVYQQCAGPGGLKATEFIADKMSLQPGSRLLDIGMCYGYQTCFLAKEYDVFAVGIDPGGREFGSHRPFIDYLMDNAAELGVFHRVLGIETGVPDTKLPDRSFDFAYSTTTFEMLRGWLDHDGYIACLREVRRVLKPGGVFGLGEPMIRSRVIPEDLQPVLSTDWRKCFSTVEETRAGLEEAGFSILEAGYAPNSQLWWEEYAMYNTFHSDEAEEKATIALNRDRWLSYGYVIARK